MRHVTKRLRWISTGVALTWFFDPVRGDERRARARAVGTDLLRGTRRVAAPPRRTSRGTSPVV